MRHSYAVYTIIEKKSKSMVKRSVILRKKPQMTTGEFWQYWEHTHGRLMAKIPGLVKYIQYHVSSDIQDDTDAPIDGIAELWFESEEAQHKAYQTKAYADVVADEPNLFEINSHFVHPVMEKKTVVIKERKPAR